jgi:hypothetical protein
MLAQYVYYFNQNLDLLTFHVQEQTERLSADLTSTRCTTFRHSKGDAVMVPPIPVRCGFLLKHLLGLGRFPNNLICML